MEHKQGHAEGPRVDVLLVEDNPYEVELTLLAFGRHFPGRQIDVVSDGQAAIDYLFCAGRYAERRSGHPALVLLDLKLPLLDGLEVLGQIKNDPKTRPIPVVMLSSSRESRDIAESYRLGVNGYIVKPVDFREFHEAVKAIGGFWLGHNLTASR